MAGVLPGDPAHHGIVESGPYGGSQPRSEEGGRWYLSRKEIEENSPSRRDGIDLKKETYLRKSYCTFLQDLGMRLKVPQVTIATAIIFSHRFYLRQSHMKNDRRTIATVCMFLAGKVEETPRPLKDVILVSYEIIHKKDSAALLRIKQKVQSPLGVLCTFVYLPSHTDISIQDVSNQMLELYEQNRMPAPQESEVEGGAVGGTSIRATEKPSSTNEESVLSSGYAQPGGMRTATFGASSASTTRTYSDQCTDNQSGSHRMTQSNDYESTGIKMLNSEQNEHHYTVMDQVTSHNRENEGETSNTYKSKFSSERLLELDEGEDNGTYEATEVLERKNEGASNKVSNGLSQSPPDAIRKIEDKVKAAREKRKKSGGDVTRKFDLMDEDDLIERELEDGIELAVENVKSKQNRRQSWTKFSNRREIENDRKYPGSTGNSSREPEVEHVEEGEMSLSDDAGAGMRSPEFRNRKRKVGSPDNHIFEGLQRHG